MQRVFQIELGAKKPKFKTGDKVARRRISERLTIQKIEFYAGSWFYSFEAMSGYKINEKYLVRACRLKDSM